MERHFDAALREVKDLLLTMAGMVEQSIELADEGLRVGDLATLTRVTEIEGKINQFQKTVDDHCVKLLALQQPLAADLRLIVSIIKINADLERMGDQAINIVQNAGHYIRSQPLKPLIDLPMMFAETRFMVREALDSFVRRDPELAKDVLKRDDVVDDLKAKVMVDVVAILKQRPDMIEAGLSLILIARNLERIGDHATNIAEDVIYAVLGDDVRHRQRLDEIS